MARIGKIKYLKKVPRIGKLISCDLKFKQIKQKKE